ncbi:MAG: hypothetical protein RL120_13890, partial [Gammaproteobacteria bacterium]
LTTDLAEVQVGGTDYEVVVTEAAHYFGVYDGAISIHNNLGAERIGSDAETDFAQLRMGSAPELIPTAPPQFLSNVTSGGC